MVLAETRLNGYVEAMSSLCFMTHCHDFQSFEEPSRVRCGVIKQLARVR